MEEKVLNHSIILNERKHIELTGVKECLGFDEETIYILTNLGKLTIKGNGLRIIDFDTDSGEFTAEGKINAFAYTYDEKSKSFFGKIFR